MINNKIIQSIFDAGRELRPVIILALVYVGGIEITLWLQDGQFANSFKAYLYFSSTMVHRIIPNIMVVLAVSAIWVLWKNANQKYETADTSLTKQLIAGGKVHLVTPAPWARLFIMAIIYQPFLNAFSLFKEQIPNFQPFSYWDITFAAMDKWIHLGFDPWQLTWNLFSQPMMTLIIDRFYIGWFYVIYGTLFAVILFDTNAVRRTRFIFSHMIMWVLLGSIAAVGFSSAGPCFYEGAIGPQASFGELMARLNSVNATYPLFAIDLQQLLWAGYSGTINGAEGISAMPSLHIAQVVLVALLAKTISNRLAIMAWVYVLIIFIGSVHLGWHYAVDGYVSAIAALVIWRLSGKFIKQKNAVE